RRRNRNANRWIVRKQCFVRHRVPERTAGEICAIGSVDHHWTVPIAVRSPAKSRHVCDDLVPARRNKVDELKLEHRFPSIDGNAVSDSKNRRFSERRIENLFRKCLAKTFRDSKHATLRIFDVLTEEDYGRIVL